LLFELFDTLQRDGFALGKALFPSEQTLEVASKLGTIVQAGRTYVQNLTPREKFAATPNVYSGNYGLDEFPMHTDLAHWEVPPRFLLLRCIRGDANVGTRLLLSSKVVGRVGALAVRRCLVQPRRTLNGRRPLMRLLDDHDGFAQIFRWDELFLLPASNQSSNVFASVLKAVHEVSKTEVFLSSPGDSLIIDNWRVLHGRSRVINSHSTRCVERIYFGELNSGDRRPNKNSEC
jgi:hypothetical protein